MIEVTLAMPRALSVLLHPAHHGILQDTTAVCFGGLNLEKAVSKQMLAHWLSDVIKPKVAWGSPVPVWLDALDP